MAKVTDDERKIIDGIERTVCRYFGIMCSSIVNNDKTMNVSLARGFIMYKAHVEYGISISKIAGVYCRTSRAVFWHINKIKNFLKVRHYQEMYLNIGNLKNNELYLHC